MQRYKKSKYRIESKVRVGECVVPLVVPFQKLADYVSFDKAVCASGVKRFIRVRAPAEDTKHKGKASILGHELKQNTHTLVGEVASGLRGRIGISIKPVPASSPSDVGFYVDERDSGAPEFSSVLQLLSLCDAIETGRSNTALPREFASSTLMETRS